MLTAVRRALELRAEHGIAGVASRAQLERVVAGAGLELWTDEPFEGRIWGVFADGVIGVRRGLLPGTQAMVIAHEAGHGVLGHAVGFYRSGPSRRVTGLEAEAHIFAWTLLLGRPAPTLDGLTRQIHLGHEARDLPLDWLFTVVSILTTTYPAVKGMPLLALA